MSDLLVPRRAFASAYSQYASASAQLRHRVAHPMLSFVGGFLFIASMFVLSPSMAQAQAAPTCLVKMSRAVPNVCKATNQLASDEFNVRNLPDWSDNLGSSFNGGACPSGQACAVKKGRELCAWFVDTSNIEGAEGTDFSMGVGCYPSDQCTPGKIFKADGQTQIPPDGNPCTGTTVCCLPSKNAAPSGTDTQGAGGGGSVALPDPLGGVSLPELAGNIIRTFAGVAGALALLMFVWGGIKWIMSGGNDGEVKKSKDILRNASIGLVLIFGAYFFVGTIIQAILANPQ